MRTWGMSTTNNQAGERTQPKRYTTRYGVEWSMDGKRWWLAIIKIKTLEEAREQFSGRRNAIASAELIAAAPTMAAELAETKAQRDALAEALNAIEVEAGMGTGVTGFPESHTPVKRLQSIATIVAHARDEAGRAQS